MSISAVLEKPATLERSVSIPDGVKVEVKGREVTVTGPKGSLTKSLVHMPVNLAVKDGRVMASVTWPRKREIAMVGTAAAHIRNMITGVTKGFVYKLKVVYAHFPMTVKVQPGKILIENFTGEKTARVARIVGKVEVKVAGDDITVEGIDREMVSQTAANIQYATRIKEKDQRVFLDGIYVYEKSEGA